MEGTGKYTTTTEVPVFNLPAIYNKITKLEIICLKEDVDSITEVIDPYGSTGEKGDGIIYVLDVLQVFKIRTGLGNLEDIVRNEREN